MAQFNYRTGTKPTIAAENKPTGRGQLKEMPDNITQTGSSATGGGSSATGGGSSAAETSSRTGSDYINQMYDSSLRSQEEQLWQNYDQGLTALEQEQEQARKQADDNLNRTYIEAEKARRNYAEVQNAYGLTSGAMGQAQLAMGNQLQADMTAIRTAQQEADAQIERERSILGKEYAAAIARAQADNDLQRAQALYEEARREEDRLLSERENAAALMAGVGDYSLYAQLYGLTPEQVKKLQEQNNRSSSTVYYVPQQEETTETSNPPGQAEGSLVAAGNQPSTEGARGALLPPGYVGQSTIDFLNRLYGLG